MKTLCEIQDEFIAGWLSAQRKTRRYGNRRRAEKAAYKVAHAALSGQGWKDEDIRVVLKDAHDVAKLAGSYTLLEIAQEVAECAQ
jgi:hypothetical protein